MTSTREQAVDALAVMNEGPHSIVYGCGVAVLLRHLADELDTVAKSADWPTAALVDKVQFVNGELAKLLRAIGSDHAD